MKKVLAFLTLLNICCFILAFAVNISFPFDEWRKGPPIHSFSAYSSGNAQKIFWVTTACFLDLCFFIIFLFHYILKKKRVSLSNWSYLIITTMIFMGSFLIIEYATRLYIKNSPGYTQFRPHPLLYWYNRGNLRDFVGPSNEIPMSTNSYGFRYKKDIPINKPANEYRIFVFGDSSAFGSDVRDEETFSAQLGKKLNDEYGDYKFRVINTACPGHTTYQGLIILKQMVLKFNPDIIIVAYNNDPGLEYVEEKTRAFRNPFIERLNIILYRSDYYLLFQRVATDFKLFLLTRPKKKYFPSLVCRVSLKDYKENIKEFMRIAKEYNIQILFIKMPVNLHTFEIFPYIKELFYDESYRDALTEICQETNHILVDVDSNWHRKQGQGLFVEFHHEGKVTEAHFHPSPKGHRKIAEQICDVIAKKRLIH